MTEEESLPLINKKTVRNFIMECFSKSRSKVADVINIAKEHNPKAFFTVEEINQLSDSSSLNNNGQNRFYFLEKFNRRR